MGRIGIALVAAAVIASACGSESQGPSDVPPSVGVSLSLSPTGIEVLGTYDAAEQDMVARPGEHRLRFELQDGTGRVMISGVVSDPRYLHGELDIDGDGSLEHHDGKLDHGIVYLRLPPVEGTLVLKEADATGLVEIGRVAFAPPADIGRVSQGIGVKQNALTVCDLVPGLDECTPKLALGSGDAGNVDILLLGDGFSEDEAGTVEGLAHTFGSEMLALDDYVDHADRFNIWYLELPSADSGIYDPEVGDEVASVFNVSFGEVAPGSDEPGRPRRCVFPDENGRVLAESIRLLAGAEIVAIMANTDEWGGCATGRFFTTTLAEGAPKIIAHELGHALFGLADEYNYGTCREPNSPNVAADPADLPWAGQVNTEVPTLTADDELQLDDDARQQLVATATAGDAVGAFEGASYCEYGAWRPSYTCRMRQSSVGFCPVCREQMDLFLESFTGEETCPERWRNDGSCDACLGNDPDCCTNTIELSLLGIIDLSFELDCEQGCGDGVCSDDEDLYACPYDCLEVANVCGDGVCNGLEDDQSCAQDCGCGAVADRDQVAPYGCFCDDGCLESGDCCEDACSQFGTCP